MRERIDGVIKGIGDFAKDHEDLLWNMFGITACAVFAWILCDSCFDAGYIAGEKAANAAAGALIDKVTEMYD